MCDVQSLKINDLVDRHKTIEEFKKWILENNPNVVDTDIEDLDWLARKICDNLFVYTDNINTAKIDFLAFLKILSLNTIIFKENPLENGL